MNDGLIDVEDANAVLGQDTGEGARQAGAILARDVKENDFLHGDDAAAQRARAFAMYDLANSSR